MRVIQSESPRQCICLATILTHLGERLGKETSGDCARGRDKLAPGLEGEKEA